MRYDFKIVILLPGDRSVRPPALRPAAAVQPAHQLLLAARAEARPLSHVARRLPRQRGQHRRAHRGDELQPPKGVRRERRGEGEPSGATRNLHLEKVNMVEISGFLGKILTCRNNNSHLVPFNLTYTPLTSPHTGVREHAKYMHFGF